MLLYSQRLAEGEWGSERGGLGVPGGNPWHPSDLYMEVGSDQKTGIGRQL